MPDLRLTFYSFDNNKNTPSKPNELLRIFERNNLKIVNFGDDERVNYQYNDLDFKIFWKNEPFFKGKDFYGQFIWSGSKPYSSGITISVTEKYEWMQAVMLFKEIFPWDNSVYGRIHLWENGKRVYTPGHSIKDCLGGFVWANFFGKPYIKMWGKNKILNAPAYKVEELYEGCILILTSNSPMESTEDESKKLIEYFGREYFYDKGRMKTILSKEEFFRSNFNSPDKSGYVAPNFEES